mgnify:CR=1 FL=1
MSFDHWAAFTAATILVLIIPGPTILLVVSQALANGRRPAPAIVAGVALGDLLAMTASLLGLGALTLASSALFTTLKWCGTLYLCSLGLQMILRASQALPMIAGTLTLSASQAFRDAAIVAQFSPKSIGFFIAFVPHFITPDRPLLLRFSIMLPTFVLLGAVNALAYALPASHLRARLHEQRHLAMLQRGSGVVLLGVVTAGLQAT